MKTQFLILLLSILIGCLSGPLPEDTLESPAPPTQPPLSLDSLSYVSYDDIDFTLDQEFANVTPEFDGLIFLPHNSPVDVLSNDLTVLEHPRRLQMLASIASKYSGIYVKPQRDTDIIVYYTAYRMNDSKMAEDVLEVYKEAWNKRLLNVSGAEIWIWDGYIDEMAGMARPQGKDSILYWDPQEGAGFVSDQVLENSPALAKTKTTLYSVHGETAYEEFFIMIDVKTELEGIQNKTTPIFNGAAEKIFNLKPLPVEEQDSTWFNETNEVSLNKSVDAEMIKEELRVLLDSFLAGNITKDEYDSAFEDYNLILESIE